MARAKSSTTKRVTAAERAKQRQIDELLPKFRAELGLHKQVAQEANELEQALKEKGAEFQMRLGRCQMLAEQLRDLGVSGEMVEVPPPVPADEKE